MANNKNSQYDSSLIVKEVHDFHGQFLRTGDAKSVVPSYFSHFRATYDGQDRPTFVTYYRGSLEHITQVGTTSAAGLGGKYFTIRSNPSNSLFVVWYNLDGLSTPPVVANAVLIEVPIMTGDTADLVAMATTLVINSAQSDNFKAARYGQTVTITTTGLGVVTNSADVNTGFLITNTPGEQVEVAELAITYSGSDPIYNGQVLKGYYYNIYSGKFEKDLTVNIDSVEIGGTVDVNVTNPVTIANPATGFATETTLQNVGNIIQDARNIREKILAAEDREQTITYADFGTKNQRITQIQYTSAIFSGTTLIKTINYTLVGNSYRRDSIEWSTV